MCLVCTMLLYWLFCGMYGVGDLKPVEKEGSGRLGIVWESVCLLGGGTGCGTA